METFDICEVPPSCHVFPPLALLTVLMVAGGSMGYEVSKYQCDWPHTCRNKGHHTRAPFPKNIVSLSRS